MKRHLLLALPLLLTASSLPLPADSGAPSQKRIITDFEDVGTWRMVANKGIKPGTWWAQDDSMGGSSKETDHDRYVGEIKFVFDPAATGTLSATFLRQKTTLVSGFLDGIEFDADGKGLPVSLRFTLADMAGKKFITTPVPLTGNGWQPYRLDLNDKTLPGFADCHFPAHLESVTLEASKPCAGSVFLDDLAFTGEFSRRDQVTIYPVADGLALPPDKAPVLRYRLRSSLPAPRPVSAHIEVQDFGGRAVFTGDQKATLPAFGQAMAEFSLPVLPIGAYAAEVTVDTGSTKVTYDDPFGIFVPNGQRLNHQKMWFALNSFNTWKCEGENDLNFEWMKELGIDLVRFGASANRLEPQPGVFGFAGYKALLDRFTAAGIDVQLLYDTTPTWTQAAGSKADGRKAEDDDEAFARHITNVATFFKQFPVVKYVEFWNEPDAGDPDSGFFRGDAAAYMRMFAVFSKAFRAAAPDIKITNAGLTVLHPKERPGFAEAVIKQGAPFYDVAAFHAHGPLSNYIEREELIEKWMREAGVDKPICNTETGERSGYDARGRSVQAVTLVKKITYAKSRPSSEFYSWFSLKDYWDMDPKADDSWGLVTSDNRPKPAFLAYNNLIRELANTTPAGTASLGDGIETYAFKRGDGMVYVCWSKPGSGGGLLWLKSGKPATETDMFGASESLPTLAGMMPVSLGLNPVYLTVPGAEGLAACAAGEEPVTVPDNILVDEAKTGSFPVRLKAPAGSAIAGKIVLQDSGSQALWTQAFSLTAGQASQFDVPLAVLPAGELTPQSYALVLQSGAAGTAPLKFPLNLFSTYTIRKAPGNPLASDQGDFVKSLPAITLDRQQDVFELAFDPAIPPWGGPRDLSVNTRACHDATGFYFRFDVTDDKFLPYVKPEEMWRGDSIQLALAGASQKSYTVLTLGLCQGKPVIWCNDSPVAGSVGRWDVPARIARSGTVTSYEVYIPYDKLGVGGSGFGPLLRFSFIANEDDGQGRVRWMHWHEGLGVGGMNLNVLGYGSLEE